MHYLNKNIGNYGENLAEAYLKKCGYTILDKNYYCKIGEIDLIGMDTNIICFIEVKTRYSTFYGYPSEAIIKKKQYKIYRTAQLYIIKNKLFEQNFRFDVVEILLDVNSKEPSIKLLKNAFYV
ncbi:YraN family protein [Haloimpatiens sp. FM7315]|uniref:YraN family protein n=1 Tax=Haloimpatiens sp. FM7315 TaxID=3298609 RepID=UPI0035A2DA2D